MTLARTIAFWVLAALLAAAHVVVALDSLVAARFWEDEAFNLTVPLNLLSGLGYSSDGALSGSEITPFDPRISTGPTVLLPVAAVLATGMDPVLGARLVPLAFWALLLAGLWVLGRRIAGRWAALLAVALPLGFDTTGGFSPIQGPADVLGEIPAAALIVWALVVLPRRAWLAGLLVGLAVQAKFIALLALPAFAVAIWALAPGRGWPRIGTTAKRAWLPLVIAGLPSLAVELAALVSLGPSGYVTHLRNLWYFVASGGQKGAHSTVLEKLSALADAWFVPAWAVAVLALALLGLVIGGFLAERHRGRRAPALVRANLLAGLVGLGAFVGWWATASHTPLWVRHPAVGVFAFVPVLAVIAIWGGRTLLRAPSGAPPSTRSAPRTTVRIAAVALLAVLGLGTAAGALGHVRHSLEPRRETLAAQRAAVEPIREWVDRTGTPWLAAQPWGAAVSAIVLSGAHVGLFDAPAMDGVPRVTGESCATEVLAEGRGYRVCAAP
ncbi:hypothetical protein [Agromyces soli]|uniref:DUF2029 domain-containing protein n=1 Tax=Agromyces soli TaxID=659012 RepID=A0ABY4APE6_9MICO|nr:hypothetical protein [Agromyces soli]UOE25030.1 hypothetical protein MTP13_11780 [Agromyces soli]